MSFGLFRPAVLTVIGVSTTLVFTAVVVMILLRTGGPNAVSDNAVLIGALVGLGGVFTSQMVNAAIEYQRSENARKADLAERVRERLSAEAQRTRELELAEQRNQADAF